MTKHLPMDQIISDYASGLSTKYIGMKYGYSENAVRRRLRRAGVEIRPFGKGGWRLFLPMDQIISDYASGLSTKYIGMKYGYSENAVRRRLRWAGVEMRSKGPMKKTGNI